MLEARRQRDAAIYDQQRVQATNEFFGLLLDEIGTDEQLTPVELLDRGVQLLDQQYGTEPPFIGRMYLEVSHRYADLALPARALEMEERAEAAARRANDAGLLAAALCSGAPSDRLLQDPEGFRARVSEAKTLLASVHEPSLDDRMRCLIAEALILEADGEQTKAMDLLRGGRRTLEESPASSSRLLGILLNHLSYLHFKRHELDESLALNEEILALNARSGRDNTIGQTVIQLNSAALLEAMGELAAAAEIQKSVLERMSKLGVVEEQLTPTTTSYGATLARLSRLDEALPILVRSRDHATATGNVFVVATTNLQIARVLTLQGRFAEAEERLQAAEATFVRTPESFAANLAAIELIRVVSLLSRGRLTEARGRIETALSEVGYPDALHSQSARAILNVAIRVVLAEEDFQRAEEMATRLLSLSESVARDPRLSGHVGQALVFRAKARIGLGDSASAILDLERALPSLSNGLGEDNVERIEASKLLARLRQHSD